MVSSSGTTVASSSQVIGVDTCAPTRGRTHHAPNTVLWGAFWLKSTNTRRAALLLPPRRGDAVGVAALELAGERHRRGPHLVAVPAGLERDVEVQATRARRLDVRLEAELLEQVVGEHRALLELLEVDARRRVEVDAQLVGHLEVGEPVRPHVEPEAPLVHAPQQVAEVGGHQGVARGAVGRGDDGGREPVGRRLGHPLLEERLAARALRVALEEHRAVAHRLHERALDGPVVLDEVELRLAALAEEDLVGMGDRHRVPPGLDHDLVGHGLSVPGRLVPGRAGRPPAGQTVALAARRPVLMATSLRDIPGANRARKRRRAERGLWAPPRPTTLDMTPGGLRLDRTKTPRRYNRPGRQIDLFLILLVVGAIAVGGVDLLRVLGRHPRPRRERRDRRRAGAHPRRRRGARRPDHASTAPTSCTAPT